MKGKHIKLVGWPTIVFMILACFVGSSYQLVKKYYESGSVEQNQITISVINFFIGLTIILLVVRHANKPEE